PFTVEADFHLALRDLEVCDERQQLVRVGVLRGQDDERDEGRFSVELSPMSDVWRRRMVSERVCSGTPMDLRRFESMKTGDDADETVRAPYLRPPLANEFVGGLLRRDRETTAAQRTAVRS